MRKDRNDKDKYTLIFVEQRGNHSKLTNKKEKNIRSIYRSDKKLLWLHQS